MTDTPAWLTANPPERRATEILVPVVMKVGPVWLHHDQRGAWYAALETSLSVEPIWDCDHDHPTKTEAWQCAEQAAHAAALTLTGTNDD